MVKNPPSNTGDAGDVGSIPGLGRFPGEVNGNLLQCSCLRLLWTEDWLAIVHGITKESCMTW